MVNYKSSNISISATSLVLFSFGNDSVPHWKDSCLVFKNCTFLFLCMYVYAHIHVHACVYTCMLGTEENLNKLIPPHQEVSDHGF